MTKGRIRIKQAGAKCIEKYNVRSYDDDLNLTTEEKENVYESTPKIDKQRENTLNKVLKKLKRKNVILTGITETEEYKIIEYEVL